MDPSFTVTHQLSVICWGTCVRPNLQRDGRGREKDSPMRTSAIKCTAVLSLMQLGPADGYSATRLLAQPWVRPQMHAASQPRMQAIDDDAWRLPPNALVLAKHMEQFEMLRVHGMPDPNVCDVYVHAVGSQKFWFVGQSCVRDGVGGEDGPVLSVIRQKQLILEHAKALQPSELEKADQVEVWCAPLFAELASTQGRVHSLADIDTDQRMVQRMASSGDGSGEEAGAALAMVDVGFLPAEKHAVVDDGSGYCVRLRPDGQFPMNCPWLCLVARVST
jgi:hypothetical protein